ncbi:class I SAM-dependent methyltransferase [Micromonospora sp. NPDC005806]|uniref:class I SAM-dependent methyltransferase n=1 Tax=Micromonospora sp. NPDC005806 TaxID=3364234 RepID=UPI0036C405E7
MARPGGRWLSGRHEWTERPLAISTGRVALPLARRGITVEGIEGSPLMLEQLRARAGGADIPVVLGDMADVAVDGPYDLAYLVFNTFFNLPDQDRQVDCFVNVGRVLAPGGRFVVEAFIQDLTEFDRNQRVTTRAIDEDSVSMEFLQHDPVAQAVTYQRVTFDAAGTTLRPLGLRYCWPSELDLMARLAGMRLRERWDFWDRTPVHRRQPSPRLGLRAGPGGYGRRMTEPTHLVTATMRQEPGEGLRHPQAYLFARKP